MKAQRRNLTVEGIVLKKEDGRALKGAIVRIYDENRNPIDSNEFDGGTDASGRFTMTVPAADDYWLVVAKHTNAHKYLAPPRWISVNANLTGVVVVPKKEGTQLKPGADDTVDEKFLMETLSACIARAQRALANGETPVDVWKDVLDFMPKVLNPNTIGAPATKDVATMTSCAECRRRYYTPGTPYYLNYPLYVQCVMGPCT